MEDFTYYVVLTVSSQDLSSGHLSNLEGLYIPIAPQSPGSLLHASCQCDLKIMTQPGPQHLRMIAGIFWLQRELKVSLS